MGAEKLENWSGMGASGFLILASLKLREPQTCLNADGKELWKMEEVGDITERRL